MYSKWLGPLRGVRLIVCLILIPAVLTAQTTPALPHDTEIPRFYVIDEGLYRGGQPDESGFEFLKQKRIRTVINFRTEDEESEIVKQLGMTYVWIPMSIQPWSKIPESAIEKFFAIVNNPENYPIFFHCRRGADRTGAMAAFYRMAVQGWNGKRAYSEARDIGMRWWFLSVKKQIHNFQPTLPASRSSLLDGSESTVYTCWQEYLAS